MIPIPEIPPRLGSNRKMIPIPEIPPRLGCRRRPERFHSGHHSHLT